jgi:hypothetical protein
MKTIYKILLFTMFYQYSVAQDNPYKIFGYEVKNKYEDDFDKVVIVNSDSLSTIKKVVFDTEKRQIHLFDANESLIGSIDILGEEFYQFITTDPLSEKYYSLSPYNYVANNPLIYIDPDGMQIDISALIKSKDHAQAFIIFAKTKEGKRFLDKYASKGQKLEYGGKVFYEAKEAGKYDKKGVDLNYMVGPDKTGSSTKATANGKNDFDVNIEIAKEGFGSDDKTFNLTKSISHESFLHGEIETKDILDGKRDLSSVPEEYRQYGAHSDHYYVSREYFADSKDPNVQSFPTNTLSVLRQASNQLGLKYSDTQIKTIMWQFNGSLIKVDPKTGKLSYKK